MYVVYKKRSALVVLTSSRATIVLSAFHSTLTIINAYGPTYQVTLRNRDKQYDFYAALDSITTRYPSSALIVIAGYFNSKLGNKLTNELSMGEHSCGIRNTNGTVLAGFLKTHGMFACNTPFQHATRQKTTWQGQFRDATNWNIVPIYNDFVICRQSHKSLLADSRAPAGTLLDSDHRLLIAQLDLSRLPITYGVKSRSHHQRNTLATTPNSWPVGLFVSSSAMQCQRRYQR